MLKLFSLFDRKASIYNSPIVYRTVADATRAFQEAVNDPKSGSICKHSADFDLFFVMQFDEFSGEPSVPEGGGFIVNGGALKEVSNG